jgi:hypothetical protein
MDKATRDRLRPVVERIGGSTVPTWTVKVGGEVWGIVTRTTAEGQEMIYRATYWARGQSHVYPEAFRGEFGSVEAACAIMDHADLTPEVPEGDFAKGDD